MGIEMQKVIKKKKEKQKYIQTTTFDFFFQGYKEHLHLTLTSRL